MTNSVQPFNHCNSGIVFAAWLLLSCMASAHADNAASTDVQKSIQALREVDIFATGYIGFAGHISKQQMLYVDILKQRNAEAIFLQIINAPDISYAARLYSLCGLKTLSSRHYKPAKEKTLNYQGKVSTMNADIMTMQELSYLVNKIEKNGCSKHSKSKNQPH